MNKFVFLFACVATLGAASALKCYNCAGPNCESEMKTWGTRTCGDSGVLSKDHVAVCVKMVYKDKATQKTMVERKCSVSETKDGKPDFHCNAPVNGELVECPVCTSELCNSAPSVRLSLFTLSSVILAFLVPKFL